MTPKEASRKENEKKVWRNLYPELDSKTMTPKFPIGDITKKRKHMIKDTLKDGWKRFLQFLKLN